MQTVTLVTMQPILLLSEMSTARIHDDVKFHIIVVKCKQSLSNTHTHKDFSSLELKKFGRTFQNGDVCQIELLTSFCTLYNPKVRDYQFSKVT